MEREGKNTTQVPTLGRFLLLGKVSNYMISTFIVLTEDKEEEWLHIIVEIFMVQEQFGNVAKVFTVGRVFVAIYLED